MGFLLGEARREAFSIPRLFKGGILGLSKHSRLLGVGRRVGAVMLSPTSWPAPFPPAHSWFAVETRTLLLTTRAIAGARRLPWERMSKLTRQQYQGGFSESLPEQPRWLHRLMN